MIDYLLYSIKFSIVIFTLKTTMELYMKYHLLSFVAIATLTFPAYADVTPRIEIEWLGGATMRVQFDGYTLLTDPAFGEGKEAFEMIDPNAAPDGTAPVPVMHQRLVPFPSMDTNAVNQMLISHLHEDHFDQRAEKVLRKDTPTVLPVSDAARFREKGFVAGQALDWGQMLRIDTAHGHIEITAVPAEHTASVNPEIIALLGKGNGYWMTFHQGDWSRSVYWTGDTFPTTQVIGSVKRLGRPDLLVGHVGDVGRNGLFGQVSMSSVELRMLADAVKPKGVLPIHHSTYTVYREPAWKVAKQFADVTYRFDLPSAGRTLVIK